MRVTIAGSGTDADPYRPGLPQGVGYTVLEWHQDGTVTVKPDDAYLSASRDLAARLTVVDKVRADELDDDTVSQLVALFPPLTAGLDGKAGEVYAWDGTLVEVIQDHTTQQDWIDAMDPSLFKVHRAYGVVTDWVQPTGSTDAYQTGEAVRYEGNIYTSLIDANTTVPGSDDRWWELVD